MLTRRHFLGAAAAGGFPLALMPTTSPLFAQDVLPAPPRMRDAVLTQLTRELARLRRAAHAPLPRGEHYRGMAATLRLQAALDLDQAVTDGLARLVATRGRAWVLGIPVDRAALRAHLAAAGVTLAPGELRVGLDPEPVRARVLDEMLSPGYDYAETLRSLAGVLDSVPDDSPSGDMTPRFRTSNFESCLEYHQMLVYLQFGLVVLCASGNAAGCIATAASIALIQHLLFMAGC